jgi:hypothetical protein
MVFLLNSFASPVKIWERLPLINERGPRMKTSTRRKFIAGAVPAVALAAAPVEARQGGTAQPAREKVQ